MYNVDKKKSEAEARNAAQAEQHLIAILLNDNAQLAAIDLRAEWFENQATRKLFKAIVDLINARRVADIVTVADYLEKEHPSIAWYAEIADIMQNSIAQTSSAPLYGEILRSRYNRRSAEKIAYMLLQDVGKGQDAIDKAIRDLMDLETEESARNFDSKETIKAAVEKVEKAFERFQDDGSIVGIDTGLQELNDVTGGWQDSDLIVIPARPAMGKTAAMLNFCLSGDVPFGIISSEQSFDQIGQRLIAIDGGISGSSIRKGSLEGEDWDRLSLSARRLLERQFWINDDPTITIDAIRRQARAWKYQNGIKLLAVDYIQRIYPSDPRAPKHIQVEDIVRGLKSLAKELDIPIVALAQVSRECEKRPDRRPLMGDISDASAIEKEADLIITLYRDEVYEPETVSKGIAELGIVKNRHGGTGTVFASWSGRTFKLSNLKRAS